MGVFCICVLFERLWNDVLTLCCVVCLFLWGLVLDLYVVFV